MKNETRGHNVLFPNLTGSYFAHVHTHAHSGILHIRLVLVDYRLTKKKYNRLVNKSTNSRISPTWANTVPYDYEHGTHPS